IVTIGGDHEVNQVFFDNVRVPAANLVGEAGRGWEYAKYLLEFERGGGAPSIRCRVALDRHREILRHGNCDERPIDHEDQQIELGRLEAEVMALEMLDMRQVAARENGERPGPGASVVKTLGSELLQRISQASMAALGLDALPDIAFEPPDFAPANDIPIPEHAWAMTRRHLNGLAGTIFGGASEVQRDIIARMVID
ncbi:MAG TPA: acyl-CoA dehydrogenase family protein, partial [Hyphomicrobiaceae bacterium]|nr:acyl-CoA dehydrogenase family protein [Hyphomicrobiaceae bacterium]